MNIFQSRFYSINVAFLSIVGLWPYIILERWQYIKRIMCTISLLSIIIPQLIKLVEIWGDYDKILECLSPVGVQAFGLIKAIFCIVKRENMTKLSKAVETDWSTLKNDKEVEILTKYAQQGRNLAVFYTGVVYLTSFIYVLPPLFPKVMDIIAPLNYTRLPIVLLYSEYYVDPDEYFVPILLIEYAGIFVTATILIGLDTMFVSYIMHLCGILAIIGYRLENLPLKDSKYNFEADAMSTDNDEICHQEIVFCIDRHYKAIEVANIIESSYTISHLILLGYSVIFLSMSALQMLFKFGDINQMIRLFQFTLGQSFLILISSWPCQKLIDQNVIFSDSLYATKWYSLSERNKNLLKFVMLRASRPPKITAGKVFLMSIENFGVSMKTTMSYITVFASIR